MSFIESNREYLSRSKRRAEQYDDNCSQPMMDNFPKSKLPDCPTRDDIVVDHCRNEDTINRCSDQIDHHQLVNSVSSNCKVASKVSSPDESIPYNQLLRHKSNFRLKSSSRIDTSKQNRASFSTTEIVEHNNMMSTREKDVVRTL